MTWKLFRVRPKGYFMPASLQEIAWCVLNGAAEQRRHRRDEWICSNHWHIRERLIKAAGSKRARVWTGTHTHTHVCTGHANSDSDVLHDIKRGVINKDTSGGCERGANHECWSSETQVGTGWNMTCWKWHYTMVSVNINLIWPWRLYSLSAPKKFNITDEKIKVKLEWISENSISMHEKYHRRHSRQ